MIDINFSTEALLARISLRQMHCAHPNFSVPGPCVFCGVKLTMTELKALRRLNSGKMTAWREPELTWAQQACEEKAHRGHEIEFTGYACAGEKQFPHRLGRCKGCKLVRPRPQFKGLATIFKRYGSIHAPVSNPAPAPAEKEDKDRGGKPLGW